MTTPKKKRQENTALRTTFHPAYWEVKAEPVGELLRTKIEEAKKDPDDFLRRRLIEAYSLVGVGKTRKAAIADLIKKLGDYQRETVEMCDELLGLISSDSQNSEAREYLNHYRSIALGVIAVVEASQ